MRFRTDELETVDRIFVIITAWLDVTRVSKELPSVFVWATTSLLS
jgi:hypothetical protein